jgi:hypothetical protein
MERNSDATLGGKTWTSAWANPVWGLEPPYLAHSHGGEEKNEKGEEKERRGGQNYLTLTHFFLKRPNKN